MAVGCLIAAIIILSVFSVYCIYKETTVPAEEAFPYFVGAMASGTVLITVAIII